MIGHNKEYMNAWQLLNAHLSWKKNVKLTRHLLCPHRLRFGVNKADFVCLWMASSFYIFTIDWHHSKTLIPYGSKVASLSPNWVKQCPFSAVLTSPSGGLEFQFYLHCVSGIPLYSLQALWYQMMLVQQNKIYKCPYLWLITSFWCSEMHCAFYKQILV